MSARDWMRRGFEPDEAEWAAATEGAWFMRLVAKHAGWPRQAGLRRVAGRVGLLVGCRALVVHRWAWMRGVRFR